MIAVRCCRRRNRQRANEAHRSLVDVVTLTIEQHDWQHYICFQTATIDCHFFSCLFRYEQQRVKQFAVRQRVRGRVRHNVGRVALIRRLSDGAVGG